jgi:hypothetical protein
MGLIDFFYQVMPVASAIIYRGAGSMHGVQYMYCTAGSDFDKVSLFRCAAYNFGRSIKI